ncbi:VOC family protein [Bradyrhizobium sp. ISRA432]|uniref:VOC family protein n=2 Tax=Bradyrhizobium TaxID=374 RepID=UPI0024791F1B|nr:MULTISPECIES: VOC family protein [unclassified Bradyrhizobium]WGR79296.1 VOC family protein [Bradyrhizobium sp. ISRA430]WGR89634.1 VOC family protein [Bradyrhizobium sp. ISRA432]
MTRPSAEPQRASRHTLFKDRVEDSAHDMGWVVLHGFIKPEETAMATKVKPVPEGYHTVTPYLVVDGAEKIIRFMKDAFGAQPVFEPMMRPDGKVGHAEFKIGNSVVMISDSSDRAQATSTMLYLYVPNVDAVYQKALKAGGTSLMEPADQFYGDRSGGVTDPAGNRWHIGTHIEDVSPAELKKRAAEAMKQHKAA